MIARFDDAGAGYQCDVAGANAEIVRNGYGLDGWFAGGCGCHSELAGLSTGGFIHDAGNGLAIKGLHLRVLSSGVSLFMFKHERGCLGMAKCRMLAVTFLAGMMAVAQGNETRIADNLQHYTLENGMNVFVYPRKTAPVFCGMIYVNAGSAEEQAGETGLAHLLEHMAFKGTPWIGTTDWEAERPVLIEIEKVGAELAREQGKLRPDKDRMTELSARLKELQAQAAEFTVPNEYDQIITRAGGTGVNASTSRDWTNYFMTLPSSQLELWMMMESQRLLFPSWREFYQERDVVAEERLMRYEDHPDGKLFETLLSTTFSAHPYRNPTIGWMSDIYNLTVEKTDAFYKRWYVPENMVAILVGDVDPDEVRTLVEKYFGGIPAAKSPPLAVTKEPRQSGERRVKVRFDSEPKMLISWHKPTFPDKDAYVIEVIQFLLTESGRSSRLYERLVKTDGICQDVSSFTTPGDKYDNSFVVYLVPRAPHTAAEAERATYEEIERIKREPITDEELDKLRNQIDAHFVKDLESNTNFARKLGHYFLATGDPNVLDTLRDEMKNVTAQDIMRTAQKYLVPDNRNVVELVPARRPAITAPVPAQGIEIRADDQSTTATEESVEAEAAPEAELETAESDDVTTDAEQAADDAPQNEENEQ